MLEYPHKSALVNHSLCLGYKNLFSEPEMLFKSSSWGNH